MAGEDPGGKQAGLVLNLETLADLEDLIGPARLASMIQTFFADGRRRAGILAADPQASGALLEHAHALISLSAHFGFEELSTLCAGLQDEAGNGAELDRVAALSAAIDRAETAVVSRPEAG